MENNPAPSAHNELLTPYSSLLTKSAFNHSCHAELVSASERHPHTGLQAVGQRVAFTMAEILLSLTIIGVVAAITLPSLTGNINERTWNTQRKALYSRMSQAISLMPALNGYGQYTYTNGDDGTISTGVDTATETFITSGLAKVLKINNICDNSHLPDCGIPSRITTLNTGSLAIPTTLFELNSMFYETISDTTETFQNPQSYVNTKAVAFETQNGESIVAYYNPYCTGTAGEYYWKYSQVQMCANFIFDLNGTKGPNTVGKDIGFMTALYSSNSVLVMPLPANKDLDSGMYQTMAASSCTSFNNEYRVPNREELYSMFYNKELIGNMMPDYYWSSTLIGTSNDIEAFRLSFESGRGGRSPKTINDYVRCIKR